MYRDSSPRRSSTIREGDAVPPQPWQLYNAIGSVKELTDATLRAALDRLGTPYGKKDDLPVLMKKWRRTVGPLALPDLQGRTRSVKRRRQWRNLVTFLGEWWNTYGRGHGQPKYPPGLKARHARLAADAAETCVRFIVTTMDDLQRLPPDGNNPQSRTLTRS
jgi:Abortive infection C-terminus